MKVFDWDPEDEDHDEKQYFIEFNNTHNGDIPEPWMNRILSKLAFSDALPEWWASPEALKAWNMENARSPHLTSTYPVYLRKPYENDTSHRFTSVSRRRIEYHPLVWRSMATFPHTPKLSFTIGGPLDTMYPVTRSPGVTVSDFVHAISAE